MTMQQPRGRVLVVDDQPSNIELLHDIFKAVHEVEFAMDGEKAIDMAESALPDIVLLDVQLPGIDGFEVCKRLKDNPKTQHIPIIFLTARRDVDDMVKGYKMGAVDYVTKPFNWFELIAKVNTQLVLKDVKAELRNAYQREEQFFRQIQLSIEESDMTLSGKRAPVRQKILIVDDSVNSIETLENVLRDEYELFFATSAEEAKRVAIEVVPHLIMLDVVLPDSSGYEVCEELKRQAETQDIPIVFVTSRDSAEDEVRGFQAGAIDYIVKPYRPNIVTVRMRNLLELVRNRDLLKRLTLTDALTNIPNRRNFQEVYQREWFRALRSGEPLSILMMDIDNFKRYNDYYGHPQGDVCLKKVAKALYTARKRNTDFLARIGGEEFVMVLPNTDQDGANNFATSVLNAVRQLNIPHVQNENKGQVTLSIGLLTCKPSHKIKRDEALSLADECLYQAKQQGRDRIAQRDMTI
ncbi:response regulator [Oleiphilus messinensis]|uniref:diguanylate cyclase n=1 Tax=Oleiphilus messinensis TaxID=141451 RepID=A0A1Y0IAS9_9GAMM|nr:PleD family two-component system response regulator [Oleiphilus messinensis]ARU57608.1 response regulator [Oleiphilus messinensis]